MTQWMMIHPWMTFFLLVLLIGIVSNVVANICKAVMFCCGLRRGYTPSELSTALKPEKEDSSEGEDTDN